MTYLKLYNGIKMPQLGFGCGGLINFGDNSDRVTEVILNAIKIGYRHLDTASMYNTEKNVGAAIKKSGIARKDFFVTTKVDLKEMGYEMTLKAARDSLQKLGLDYIDLYLIHWPIKETYLDTWRALEKLYQDGLVKAIGGSNFMIKHFEGIASQARVKPMTNQIELHPYFSQEDMQAYCKKEGIVLTAWSPLGTGTWSGVDNSIRPVQSLEIIKIGEKYKKSAAQVILRWMIQIGISTIPKSDKPKRMKENFEIFDFKLSEEDITIINSLNKNFSIGSLTGNRELAKRL